MVRKAKNVVNKSVINEENDQLQVYSTENPNETKNMLKLVSTVDNHYLTFTI